MRCGTPPERPHADRHHAYQADRNAVRTVRPQGRQKVGVPFRGPDKSPHLPNKDQPRRYNELMNPTTSTVATSKQRAGFTDDVRQRALELYAEIGPTKASAEFGPGGPNKATITKWAKAAGVECQANERTAAATRARALQWQEERATQANRWGALSALSVEKSIEAVEEGRANDARQLAITGAVAVDKADQLAGVGAGLLGPQRFDPQIVWDALGQLVDERIKLAQHDGAVVVDSAEVTAPRLTDFLQRPEPTQLEPRYSSDGDGLADDE